jgi:hypothetical protein
MQLRILPTAPSHRLPTVKRINHALLSENVNPNAVACRALGNPGNQSLRP